MCVCVCLYLVVDIVSELVCISETVQIIENGKWPGNMDIHEHRHIMDMVKALALVGLVTHSSG